MSCFNSQELKAFAFHVAERSSLQIHPEFDKVRGIRCSLDHYSRPYHRWDSSLLYFVLFQRPCYANRRLFPLAFHQD